MQKWPTPCQQSMAVSVEYHSHTFEPNCNLSLSANKRKATDDTQPQAKKAKFDGDAPAESKTVFVGRLAWSVNNDLLAQEFARCGEVESANVQMDRDSGKSRGFGYVRFTTSEAVEKALLMNGHEIDGRAVNIDRSTPDKSQARDKRAKAFGDNQTSPPSSTLFVGNLSFDVLEDTVWSFFNDFGVKSVRLPTDRDTGRPKGFGYVEFEDVDRRPLKPQMALILMDEVSVWIILNLGVLREVMVEVVDLAIEVAMVKVMDLVTEVVAVDLVAVVVLVVVVAVVAKAAVVGLVGAVVKVMTEVVPLEACLKMVILLSLKTKKPPMERTKKSPLKTENPPSRLKTKKSLKLCLSSRLFFFICIISP